MPERVVYKFVELSIVTDEALEEVVNEWVGKGWQLDGIRFAMPVLSLSKGETPRVGRRWRSSPSSGHRSARNSLLLTG